MTDHHSDIAEPFAPGTCRAAGLVPDVAHPELWRIPGTGWRVYDATAARAAQNDAAGDEFVWGYDHDDDGQEYGQVESLHRALSCIQAAHLAMPAQPASADTVAAAIAHCISLCPAPNTRRIDLTAVDIGILLSALYDKQLETESYMGGYRDDEKPRPSDTCCDYHRAGFEERLSQKRALRQRLDRVKTLITRVEALESAQPHEGDTSA